MDVVCRCSRKSISTYRAPEEQTSVLRDPQVVRERLYTVGSLGSFVLRAAPDVRRMCSSGTRGSDSRRAIRHSSASGAWSDSTRAWRCRVRQLVDIRCRSGTAGYYLTKRRRYKLYCINSVRLYDMIDGGMLFRVEYRCGCMVSRRKYIVGAVGGAGITGILWTSMRNPSVKRMYSFDSNNPVLNDVDKQQNEDEKIFSTIITSEEEARRRGEWDVINSHPEYYNVDDKEFLSVVIAFSDGENEQFDISEQKVSNGELNISGNFITSEIGGGNFTNIISKWNTNGGNTPRKVSVSIVDS